ncbi:MAG: argininosuccinate synthase, partial [Methanoregulaceae archaeon]|nr:argininosuccinate synthase [Methanoregulaceae archaeon]
MDMYMKRVFMITAVLVLAVIVVTPALAAPTQVRVVRYANDNVTILEETTVDYTWMEANLPVLGDGVTHYYHQGPTFNDTDYWDDAEWQNIASRDMGPVKG